MQKRALRLLKVWCDTLFSYQVRTGTPYTDGALLCPACHVLHGRVADLCFPLAALWAESGEEEYLVKADMLIDWSEYNLKTEDGLWQNDITQRWYATTAFSALSIGETLYHFGERLPAEYREKWQGIFVRMCRGILALDDRGSFHPVVNYYCGIAALLAMAWRLLGDRVYLERSKIWLQTALAQFDGDGLLYGEGYPLVGPDGSRTVDMGYNLEESLPLLLRYASLTGDREKFFKDRMRDHLAFLLPDGNIDNSFGTRHNKWTLWGSRTSDGVMAGLALYLEEPLFYEACRRVLSCYETYTKEGLLSLPMAHLAKEPTCLHHTFAHAKALAALVCAKMPVPPRPCALPTEEAFGIRAYQNGRLLLVSNGTFRATFSAVEANPYPGYGVEKAGGSMTLLYHKKLGAICAATTAEYFPTEILNQQYLRNTPQTPSMTPQFWICGRQSCKDPGVRLSAEGATILAQGPDWQAEYCFREDVLEIRLRTEEGNYQIPLVCGEMPAVLSEDGRGLALGEDLQIEGSVPLEVDVKKRLFHQVGGLLYLPLGIPVKGTATLRLRSLS